MSPQSPLSDPRGSTRSCSASFSQAEASLTWQPGRCCSSWTPCGASLCMASATATLMVSTSWCAVNSRTHCMQSTLLTLSPRPAHLQVWFVKHGKQHNHTQSVHCPHQHPQRSRSPMAEENSVQPRVILPSAMPSNTLSPSLTTATPSLEWLGLSARHVHSLSLPPRMLQPMRPSDLQRMQTLQDHPCVKVQHDASNNSKQLIGGYAPRQARTMQTRWQTCRTLTRQWSWKRCLPTNRSTLTLSL